MNQAQKFDFLVSLYILCVALAELMGGKTVPLINSGSLHLNASVAILLIPLIFTANDVIIEVLGKERARNVVRAGLLSVVGIIGFSLLATALPPSARFVATEPAYDAIFHTAIRISLASLIAFAAAEYADVAVFDKVRERLRSRTLWLRSNLSNIVAQLLDTTIFISLAFWATDRSLLENASFLTSLILPYWLLKSFASVLTTPLVYAGVAWLRDPSELSGAKQLRTAQT